MADGRVPGGLGRHAHAVLAGELDGRAHVVDAVGEHHARGALVGREVPGLARGLVPAVVSRRQRGSAQLRRRDRGGRISIFSHAPFGRIQGRHDGERVVAEAPWRVGRLRRRGGGVAAWSPGLVLAPPVTPAGVTLHSAGAGQGPLTPGRVTRLIHGQLAQPPRPSAVSAWTLHGAGGRRGGGDPSWPWGGLGRRLIRSDDQHAAGRVMGQLVRHAAEEIAARAGHSLVADHDQIHVALHGHVQQSRPPGRRGPRTPPAHASLLGEARGAHQDLLRASRTSPGHRGAAEHGLPMRAPRRGRRPRGAAWRPGPSPGPRPRSPRASARAQTHLCPTRTELNTISLSRRHRGRSATLPTPPRRARPRDGGTSIHLGACFRPFRGNRINCELRSACARRGRRRHQGGRGSGRAAEVSHQEESPTPLTDTEALLDGIEATARRVIEPGRAARGGGGWRSLSDRVRHGHRGVEREHPAHGRAAGRGARAPLRLPVFVDNDANCAALAEAQLVDDAPASALVMLTLGTGVGGGVIIGGEIFRGAHGLGAELGHFTIDPDGPPCPGNCPGQGCIEAYCSGQALERDATQFAPRHARQPARRRLSTTDGKVTGRTARGRRRTRAMPTPCGCSSASRACSAWRSPGT